MLLLIGIQKFHMKDSSLECTYTLLKANVVAQIVSYILYVLIYYMIHYILLYTALCLHIAQGIIYCISRCVYCTVSHIINIYPKIHTSILTLLALSHSVYYNFHMPFLPLLNYTNSLLPSCKRRSIKPP